MTLSERNIFFKAGIVFCSICTLFVLAASFITIPQIDQLIGTLYGQEMKHVLYQGTDHVFLGLETLEAKEEENIRRPSGFFQFLTGGLLKNSYIAVHINLVLTVIFSLVGIILIHSFFERTSAPEILYIAIFTIAFAFEAIRLVLPLHFIFNFPSFYVRIVFRLLLFIRYFSLFSLFAAGLCAAGMEVQKTRIVIFIIIIASFIITMGVPIDVLNWDTSLNMVNGYASMFKMIELLAFITTVISFLIAKKVRGSAEYNYVALGVLLASAGRTIFIGTDNWAGPVFGILLLSAGTWFLCSKLHKIHLWL